MSYSSPAFVFFLAFSLLLYWQCGARFRKPLLLVISTVWYASWSWVWPLFAFLLAWAHFLALRCGPRPGHALPLRHLVPLLFFDSFLLFGLRLLPHYWPALTGGPLPVPLGCGFVLLFLMGAVIDFSRSPSLAPPESVADFFLCASFFPLLMGGPVERQRQLTAELQQPRAPSFDNLADGCLVFGVGFLKLRLLADPLGGALEQEWQRPGLGLAGLGFVGILLTLRFYFEFSGFCEMGRGAALCFGIRVQPNFRPLWFTKDPADYWRRWNLSIGQWLRDYFTLPLLLRHRNVPGALVIVLSFLLMGFWHGTAWHWLLFGLFNGILVALFLALPPRPGLGLALLFPLLAGNGVLQAPDSLVRIAGAASRGPLGELPALSGALPPLVPAFLALLAWEWLSEHRQNADFFRSWPLPLRAASALAFLAWLVYGFAQAVPSAVTIAPPLYFRL